MMNTSLLSSVGVLYIDHLAVTTPALEKTIAEYLSLPGSRLLKGPAVNAAQKVSYAFIHLEGGLVVEILAPENDSPIASRVTRGGGPYHFCYAVRDIEEAVEIAKRHSAKLVVNPTPDPAFDGRRVAFLFQEAHGIFEFVEAFPPGLKSRSAEPATSSQGETMPVPRPDNGEISSRLQAVFRDILPTISEEQIAEAKMDKTVGWDSLAHIGLMMAIESEFGVDFSSDEIARLTTYALILDRLDRARSMTR